MMIKVGNEFLDFNDLIEVERQLGYQYETTDGTIEHYQRVCPRCRRLLPALAQGRLWRAVDDASPPVINAS